MKKRNMEKMATIGALTGVGGMILGTVALIHANHAFDLAGSAFDYADDAMTDVLEGCCDGNDKKESD